MTQDSRHKKVLLWPIDLWPWRPSAAPAWTWWPGTSWRGSWPGSSQGAEGTALLFLARRCTGRTFDLQWQYGSLEKGIGTNNTLIQIIKTLGLCCLNSRAISTRQYYYIILLDYYYNCGGETSKPSVSDKSAMLLVKPVHLFSSCLLCCLPFWAQASVCLEEKGSVWVLPSVSSI